MAVVMLPACQDTPGPMEIVVSEATVLAAASPTSIEGIVGSVVELLPAVLTQDAAGNPVAGVVVQFSVISGGGFIAGTTVTSNSAGIAQIGAWMLGLTAGLNEVSASSGSLTSVTFRARALPGPPATIIKLAGEGQVGTPGQIVPVPPRVMIVDAYGNGITGVEVTFSVVNGGGSITGASVTSDSSGSASPGSWRLGPLREHSLRATSGTLQAQTFTATALVPFYPCHDDNLLPESLSITSALTAQSCETADGTFYERIKVVIGQSGAYQFDLASTAFDSHIEIHGDYPVAENNASTTLNSGFKVLLAPGSYTLIVTTATSRSLGAYTVSYRKVGEDVDRCEEVFIARGSVSRQQTTLTDCQLADLSQADRFRIYIPAGATIAFHADDLSYTDHGLTVFAPSGQALAVNGPPNGWRYSIVLSAPVSGYYRLDISNYRDSGAEYLLSIQ